MMKGITEGCGAFSDIDAAHRIDGNVISAWNGVGVMVCAIEHCVGRSNLRSVEAVGIFRFGLGCNDVAALFWSLSRSVCPSTKGTSLD